MINNNHRFTFSIDSKKRPFGFTVVELLIVIVVIGIIATITVISYSGIQEKSIRTTVETDLRNAGSALESAKAKSGGYPNAAPTDLPKSDGTQYAYTYYSVTKSYCLAATSTEGDIPMIYITGGNSTIKEGSCPAETVPTYPFTITSTRDFAVETQEIATLSGTGTPGNRVFIGLCKKGTNVGSSCDGTNKATVVVGVDGKWSAVLYTYEAFTPAKLASVLGATTTGGTLCTVSNVCEIHAVEFKGNANPPTTTTGMRTDIIPAIVII